jgi:hypothetical protein
LREFVRQIFAGIPVEALPSGLLHRVWQTLGVSIHRLERVHSLFRKEQHDNFT